MYYLHRVYTDGETYYNRHVGERRPRKPGKWHYDNGSGGALCGLAVKWNRKHTIAPCMDVVCKLCRRAKGEDMDEFKNGVCKTTAKFVVCWRQRERVCDTVGEAVYQWGSLLREGLRPIDITITRRECTYTETDVDIHSLVEG